MCVNQLGELEKRKDEIQAVADLVAVGYDTPESLRQTQADSGASFPLLADKDLTVTRLYDMQLRPDWPMGGMGEIPEMGYVIVDEEGLIHLQRVELYFGDNASQILSVLKGLAEEQGT
ncbi:MAG: redoxin domain-containing protein [Candidatus Promineifilaceae bacterium]